MCFVQVKNNDVEKAIRSFRRCMQRCGVLQEYRANRFFVKPCQERILRKKELTRRAKKSLRRRAERLGY